MPKASIRTLSRNVIASLATSALALSGILVNAPAAHATSAGFSTIAAAPLYGSGCGDTQWTTMLGSSTGLPGVVIVNNFNGTGYNAWSTTCRTLATNLHNKGIKVLAYVHTNYGSDSTTTVNGRTDVYFPSGTTPGGNAPDGVLFDEFPSANCTKTSWATTIASHAYADIAALSSTATAIMWGNPGEAIPTCYLNLNSGGSELYDTFVTDEVPLSDYNSFIPYNVLEANGTTFSDGSADGYASSRFAHAVFNVPSASIHSVVDRAFNNYAANVYMTNDTGADGNPWNTYPSNTYFNSEVSYAATK